MAFEKRGVQHLKTLAGLVDVRRTRTCSGALLELSMLEMEKQRLMKEMHRAERRGAEIRGRLAEIDKKGLRLQRFVEKRSAEAAAPEARAASLPLPIHSAPTDKLKRRQLSY
ncbi:MAG: hypothetical protein A3G80_07275 [Betaproteobacteria bacterium RIFCSPLOWO2_12_FULL_62_13b]|nr:MAG: hypothetical protein A3G80_07275 [Betaproteobacteria bacterium RIFCSPLOWO2_12_FULL_62_13b]